jgi:type IV pilus assembly protein PilY1
MKIIALLLALRSKIALGGDSMKQTVYALTLLLLVVATPSQATDISQLPIDALGTVKPNIILGFDDSGSMAWEYLPDSANSLPRQQKYNYHYNPLAYNPTKTYLPWVKNVKTTTTDQLRYPNAATSLYNGSFNADGSNVRTAGSSLSSGSTYEVTYACDASGSYAYYNSYDYDTGAKFTSQSSCNGKTGSVYTMASSYSIKTGQYWQRGALNAALYYDIVNSSATSDNVNYWPVVACASSGICATIPANMSSYRIQKITIAYTDTAQIQNYANWKQYHSQRKYMVSAAMSEILPGLTGLSMGILPFNASSTSNNNTRALDASVTARTYAGSSFYASSGRMFNLDYPADVDTLLDLIYNTETSSATPTHANLKKIGTAFSGASLPLTLANDDGSNTGGRNGIVQYACQKNTAFVMTDGYANASSLPAAIAYNMTSWGAVAPYSTTYSKSLADIALAYYTLNLRPDLATAKVPVDSYTSGSGADMNTNLHMNTYALTLGVNGALYNPAADAYASPPAWPNPTLATNNIQQIDDLWHATINGRGLMFSANNPENLVTHVKNAFMDIFLRAGSRSAITVANVNMTQTNDYAYGSSFNAQGWFGDVNKYPVDLNTGVVNNSNPVWSARDQLDAKDYTSRVIFTKGNEVFGTSTLPTVPSGSTAGASVSGIVAYLSGDRSNEGSIYRIRTHLFGDAINAEPLIANGYVYQASNDGMLHALDAATGQEQWAYVPSQNIATLGQLSLNTYNHQYFVDSTPLISQYNNAAAKLLVGGLGAGSFGYYAIDVSSPLAPIAKWEFPQNSTDAKNGGTTSINKPRLIATKDPSHPYVVVISSGYNNGNGTKHSGGDGKGHIWILDPATGNTIRELITTDGAAGDPVGLSTFAAYVSNMVADNTVSALYGGDELGNIWKINASNALIASWTLTKFAALGRPITVKPELSATSAGNPLLLVGTGRLLGATDLTSSATQGFYAIQDFQAASATAITPSNLQKLVVSGGAASDRIISLPSSGAASTCLDWNHKSGDALDNYGWYIDFPEAGERVVGDPKVAIGHVAFTSNVMSANSCSAASYSWFLSLNVDSGKVCSAPVNTGSNSGIYRGGVSASRPLFISLPNGNIELITHLGNGSILTTDSGAFSLVNSAIRSWRTLKRPLR